MLLPEQNKKFLTRLIKIYYSKRPLVEPRLLPKREIAIQPIGAKSYVRHLAFPSIIRLYEYIMSKPPLHLYYSSAVYENPSAESMEAKTWICSDLIFDIDADHYSGCDKVLTVCPRCGYYAIEHLSKCPKCGFEDISKIHLLDETCFERAWGDVLKIVDAMEREFGASDIEVAFSGHRGFHVRVQDEHLIYLDRDERRAIIDYLTMKDLILERVVPPIGRRSNKALFIKFREYGLRARLLELARNLIEVRDLGDFIEVNYDDLRNLIELTKVEVDPVVTMDISRLSRFINSINGKGGLKVAKMEPTEKFTKDFTIFEPFHGKVCVRALVDLPQIKVYGKNIRLSKGMKINVDPNIAFYLAVRGLVEVIAIKDLGVNI